MIWSDAELLRSSELFDAEWYLAAHPELAVHGIAPEEHYLRVGATMGYDPGPDFSTDGYLVDAPDVAAAGVNPLLHYLRAGRAEGRAIRPAGQGESTLSSADSDASPELPLPTRHPGRRHQRAGHRRVLVVGHVAGAELFGAERSLLDLLDALVAIDLDAFVAVPSNRNREYLDALTARSVEVRVLPVPARRPRSEPDSAVVARYVELIDEVGIDAVHVNTIVPREAMVAARLRGIPAVVHAREIPTGDPDFERWLEASADEIVGSVLAEADYVVATSRAVVDAFALPGRTAVVPNVAADALVELPAEQHQLVRVALIGSVHPKKGVAEFVELAALLGSNPWARFRVIGPRTPFVHELGRIGLPANLEFAGPCPDPVSAMAEADIVVNMSTVAEGFGRTTLEAMAAGRPVIVYDRGGLPELVRDGVSGFVVPGGDVTLFAHRASRLIDDPALRSEMGAAGRRIARQEYSKDRMATKLAAAYRAILPPRDAVEQRAGDTRIPIPADNRSQFDRPYFIANRARYATATSLLFVAPDRLLCASLLGKRLHLIHFDPRTGVGEVVDATPTIDRDGEVTTDLIDFDGRSRLITANCEHGSLSLYELGDRSIEYVDSVHPQGDGQGFCHGVTFVPGRPDLVAVATLTGPRDVAIVSLDDGCRRAVFADEGWVPKSVDFDDRGRMVVCMMDAPVGRDSASEHVAKLVLLQLAPDLSNLILLDEEVFPGATLDGCCLRGDLLLVACQADDAIVAVDVSGNRMVRLPNLLGFSFPHDVDVSPDLEWLAVANYGTSDVQLRRLPLHLSSLAAAARSN